MKLYSKAKLESLCNAILKKAKKAGADEAAVEICASYNAFTRFALNRILENSGKFDVDVKLAVSVEGREALLASKNIEDADWDDFTKNAIKIAKLLPVNPEHQPPIFNQKLHPVDCYDAQTASLTHAARSQILRSLFLKAAMKNLTIFGTFSNREFIEVVANTSGSLADYLATEASFTITVRTNDGSGSGRDVSTHNRFSMIPIEQMTENTIKWAEKSKNPVEAPPGDYNVIMMPTAAMNYFSAFFWTLDARMVAEKRNSLSNHFGSSELIGKKIFDDSVSIYSIISDEEHPTKHYGNAVSMEGGFGQSAPQALFSKGLPVTYYPIVQKGVLRNLFYSSYYAKLKNVQPLAFPTLISFEGADVATNDIIAHTESGLLVNSFWYIRMVDSNHLLLTGLTRDGVFLIEDGKVTKPIKNLRFNESPLVSMNKIVEIGKPERKDTWNGAVLIPPIKVREMTFTADTDAV